MFKPRTLLRAATRALLLVILSCLFLASLWAFLPSPNPEPIDGNGIDYPTKTLLAGKVLTRVYDTRKFKSADDRRDGFAIDYQFDADNLAILVGPDYAIPLFPEQETNESLSRVAAQPSEAAEQKRATKEKEIRFLRHKLQTALLSPEGPKIEEMKQTSDLLEKLESHSKLEASIIKATNIHKVLKAILKLPEGDSLSQYFIKLRSDNLLQEWIHNLELAVDAPKQMDANVHAPVSHVPIESTEGATPPWFDFADDILLFWLIYKESMTVPISARLHKWSEEGGDFRRIELYVDMKYTSPPMEVSLLTLEIRGKDKSTIRVAVPKRPISSSPTSTYPIRAAIIQIFVPTAVFVSNLFTNIFGGIIQLIFNTVAVLFCVLLYGFLASAFIFSLWRCLGGPSFEASTQRLQTRLVILSQNKRLKFLRIDSLNDTLDSIYKSQRFKTALDICRHGWHPEADRKRAAEEEEADKMEKAVYGKSEGVDISKS